MKTQGSYDTQFFQLENRRYDSLTDDEAFSLGKVSVGIGYERPDATHFRLWRQWFRNIAYYVGFSDPGYAVEVFFDGRDPSMNLSILPYSANHIARYVRSDVSRLSSARPDWDVTPNGADQKRRRGAKVAQQHLDHYYEKFRIDAMRMEMSMWLATTGTAFYYLGWSPTAGAKRRAYKNPMDDSWLASDTLDEKTRELLDTLHSYEEIHEGDFDLDVLGAFDVRAPVGPSRWKDCDWVTVTRLRSMDWIWRNYPDVAEDITADENDWGLDAHYRRRLASLVGFSNQDFPLRGVSLAQGVEVHEHWRLADGQFKKGLLVVFTNNHLLENGPNPRAAVGLPLEQQLPIYPSVYAGVPGRLWGKSLIEDLIAPMENYNTSARQTIAHRDILSRPILMASYDANISRTDDSYGKMLKYDRAGGEPKWLEAPQMGQAQIVAAQQSEHDMQLIAAQSEASLGGNPAGVDSGLQLGMLQERDRLVIGATIKSIEEAHHGLAEGLLMLTSKMVKIPRMVRVVGKTTQADIYFYKGMDLADQTAVFIRPGSMMPHSKSETQSMWAKMIQLAAVDLTNTDVQREVVKAFEIGGMDRFFFRIDAQRRRAEIENEAFVSPPEALTEGLPMVDEFDDHKIHIEEHLAFTSTDEYELLPPIMKMAVKGHITVHQQAIAQMVQAQMLISGGMGAGGPQQGSKPKELGKPSQPRQSQPTPGSNAPAEVA
jgi:hypothetical protein